MKDETICFKCKNYILFCYGPYRCLAYPITQDGSKNYMTGGTYDRVVGYFTCEEINTDGHCPKYEPNDRKWWQVWRYIK